MVQLRMWPVTFFVTLRILLLVDVTATTSTSETTLAASSVMLTQAAASPNDTVMSSSHEELLSVYRSRLATVNESTAPALTDLGDTASSLGVSSGMKAYVGAVGLKEPPRTPLVATRTEERSISTAEAVSGTSSSQRTMWVLLQTDTTWPKIGALHLTSTCWPPQASTS